MSRTEDAAAVARVMAEYVEGTRLGDAARLRAIFHETAVMNGYLLGELRTGGPGRFFDRVDGRPAEAAYAAEVTAVEVAGATARARLIEDHLWGMSFVNDFHLLKIEGRWMIMSKIYHHDPLEA